MQKQKIKRNYLFALIYQISLIIIPLLVTPYVARILGADGLGKYSFAYTLISYFVVVLSLGFSYYGQREIAKYQNNIYQQSKVFYEVLFLRLIIIILELIINFILFFSGIYGKYSVLMLILNLELVAAVFDITFFFQGREEFAKVVSVNLIFKVLGVLCVFVFIKSSNDVYIYALLNSVFFVFGNLFLWFFLNKKIVKVKFRELNLFACLKKSMTLFIPILALNLYTLINKSLIGLITQSDYENGFYSQVEKLVFQLVILIKCLSTVMLPHNTSAVSCGKLEQVKINNYNAAHFIWLISLPLVGGIIFTASNFVPWFLGIDFNKSVLLFQVMAIVIVFIGISTVIGEQYLLPNKKDKCYILSILAGVLVSLVVNIPLIIFFGGLGASITMVITEFIIMFVMFCTVAKELSLKRIFKSMIKPLIATGVMCLAICPLSIFLVPSILNTLIIVGTGIVVYLLMILLLRDSLVLSLFKSKHKAEFKSELESMK